MTLVASQFNLTELFDILVDAVIAFNQDQRILYFNKGAEAIFGYKAEEVLGQPLDILLPERFVAIHREHFRHFLESPVRSRPMGERQPISGRRKDGSEFPAEAAIAKIQRTSEVWCIVILRDITERYRAEEALRQQVARSAVEAERNRIARDLHDSVTQALFSVSVIADVLPRIWERNPAEGKRRLEELRQLSRGALAEMRTLLLELRPASLLEADLADLLQQLCATVRSRAPVEMDVQVEGPTQAIPDKHKVALYRIAQEALNNVAKHSNAKHCTVRLHVVPRNGALPQVQLTIIDDGRGFDPNANRSAHLGLKIMRERADDIGAQLEIISRPGAGTTVRAVL
ncbi:MAG: PAS domain-containing sensor histidine kinase [Thermoflexales bacterium]|nr:PAS domain-containing sensor histidine kinase [Thermoflexales bacterium]